MQVSPHFSLRELTTTTAKYANVPGAVEVANLIQLCTLVLEPWRASIGPIHISSGFRSVSVNRAIGGSSTSDHVHGRAADCVPIDVGVDEAWRELVAMAGTLPIDQAIAYCRPRGRGWIHVSWRAEPRRELLVQPDGMKTYLPWEGYPGALVLP